MITYKFSLYPNKEQQFLLWGDANKQNFLYNYFLNQKIVAYQTDKTSISRFQQQAELTQLRKDDPSIRRIHSQVLQQITLRLDRTFQAFFKNFKKGQGFPKFRSCKKFFGITYPQKGFSIEHSKFITKAYGKIPINIHRKIQGNIKQVSITEKSGKWFLSITTDFVKVKSGNGTIGVDVGITNLAALSDGTIIKNQSHSKYFDKIINNIKSYRDLSTKKGSRRFKFLSKTIQRLYGVKERKVKDFLHKVSKNLSNKYDTIIVENLSLKKMSEGSLVGINRELRNSNLATFIGFLKYKTIFVIEVNPAYTSKTCNTCGALHEMPLSIRTMNCICGNTLDRDVNAAKNILCLGRAVLLTGRTELTVQEALALRQG